MFVVYFDRRDGRIIKVRSGFKFARRVPWYVGQFRTVGGSADTARGLFVEYLLSGTAR